MFQKLDIVAMWNGFLQREALKAMTTDEVKALWDTYDGTNEPGGFSGEDVHRDLNLRGEGGYCAV